MPLRVQKQFDVTLNTGRYIYYTYDIAGGTYVRGVARCADGLTAWYGFTGGLIFNWGGYTDRGGGVLFSYPWMRDNFYAVPSMLYLKLRGKPVCLTTYGSYIVTSPIYTPCGPVKHIPDGREPRDWYDQSLHYDGDAFYLVDPVYPYIALFRLDENLNPVLLSTLTLPADAIRMEVWVCRRATSHPYTGIALVTHIIGGEWVYRVYALKRVGDSVTLDLMYTMPYPYRRTLASAYVDENHLSGVIIIYNWDQGCYEIHTFKWRVGESFPPPLTLRERVPYQMPVIAAMLTPDNYVAVFNYQDGAIVTGADNYTFPQSVSYGDNYATPMCVYTSRYGYGGLFIYIPRDEYWSHMLRELEAYVDSCRGGGRRLADGSIVYADTGDKVPLGRCVDGGAVYMVAFNRENRNLEVYNLMDGGGGRVRSALVRSTPAPFDNVADPRVAWRPLQLCDGHFCYLTARIGGQWRLVKLNLWTLETVQSQVTLLEDEAHRVKYRLMGRTLYLTAARQWGSTVRAAAVDADTMTTLWHTVVDTGITPILASTPLDLDTERGKLAALAMHTDENSRCMAELVYTDGKCETVKWENLSEVPRVPLDARQLFVDAWWGDGKIYAVAFANPYRFFPDPAALLSMEYEDGSFTGRVLHKLQIILSSLLDNSAFAHFISFRVDGWRKFTWLVEPHPEFAYPPEEWHGEFWWPLFCADSPLITTLDGSIQYTAPGFAMIPGTTIIGDYMCIVTVPPPPPPPPSRRVATLFRRSRRLYSL